MNKLTDEQLKELRELYRGECKWAADPEHVRSLLQEVERLKEEYAAEKVAHNEHATELINACKERDNLKGQLQDALNTLNWYVDSSMDEYVGDCAIRAAEAIERTQEGKKG
ncbi:hypothetical protein [Paenibacillus apiarius]|uniref:hypothetical protein n=1 Tax=Paenibacillus apiarius TaxID=46240 RepID=UPI003B3AD82C